MNQSYRKPYKFPKANKDRKALINDALSIGTNIRVDELDCSKSFSRVSSEKTPQEVLTLALKQKNTHWNFIHRDAICGDPEKFDVGFCTMCLRPEYFLWIDLTIEDGEKLIKKYKLETI